MGAEAHAAQLELAVNRGRKVSGGDVEFDSSSRRARSGVHILKVQLDVVHCCRLRGQGSNVEFEEVQAGDRGTVICEVT